MSLRLVSCCGHSPSMMGTSPPVLPAHTGTSGFSLPLHELPSPTIPDRAQIFSKTIPRVAIGRF